MRKRAARTHAETFNREDFVRKSVTCRFCRMDQDVMRYTGQARLPLHRKGDGNACDGSGQLLEDAAIGHQRELVLDPELGNSKLPNFYEKTDLDEFGF